MKLMYVQDSLGTGGAERSNADLWYYLIEQGNIELKIVVLEHREVGIESEILNAGFDVTFLKEGNFLNQVNQLVREIRNFKPDLVQSVLFKSAIRVRMAKKITSFFHLEYIVNCSYSEIRYKDPKINNFGLSFFKRMNRFTQKFGVDHFVAITQEVKKHAIKHLNIRPDKISVIPRGRKANTYLDEKEKIRREIRNELKIAEDAVLFIHVGRQEYQKAHLDLLNAILAEDEELNRKKVEFIFCGRKGNSSKNIEQFIQQYPLKTPMQWLGHRDDVHKLLVAADVFIFPSLFEGLGGSLIEAQAAGLPIIASDIPVFKEVVNEQENALLFKTSSPEELADKMLELVKDKNRRLEMEQKSLEQYRNKFQIEDVHNQVLDLYEKLVK